MASSLHGLHGKIGCCGCCVPREIARRVVSREDKIRSWDLTEFQGDDIGTGGSSWRIINNYMTYVPMLKGCVDENGKLVGLPNSIAATAYKYTWVFILQLGCLSEDGKKILRPENQTTDVFECEELKL